MTQRLRRAPLVVAALLSAILVSSTASAAPRREARTVRERTIAALVSVFPEVWTAIRNLWAKEGSTLDPFGNPKPNTAEPPPSTSGTSSGQ
jgi:hypothetical protein